ncbi:MAG: DUF971 domain-containing protein [Gammaproteobacteria bacterium]|nr:DUF971 domain-containing protein [Gammaproteobacteria bacterium]
MNAPTPAPRKVLLHRRSRELELTWPDGHSDRLPCEYLRVYSPSAEVRGHGGGEPALVPGKREVNVSSIEPIGAYALRLVFDDGHDSGLYSWPLLHDLAECRPQYWSRYLQRLAEQGMSRDSDVVKLSALPKKFAPPR